MHEEQIKQRIRYLIEHGGIYPDACRQKQCASKVLAVATACAVVGAALALSVCHLFR